MIQTIEIIIRHGIQENINALLLKDKKICYLNNKKYEVSDTFIEELLKIICNKGSCFISC